MQLVQGIDSSAVKSFEKLAGHLGKKEIHLLIVNPSEKVRISFESTGLTSDTFERLQFLAVVKDPWLIENGFLTPTMKMKRSKLEDTYGPKSEEWYGAGRGIVWEA